MTKNTAYANIRQGWKGLPGTNPLAYYEKVKFTAVKSFKILAPDRQTDRYTDRETQREDA
jgi:hypothetical protein